MKPEDQFAKGVHLLDATPLSNQTIQAKRASDLLSQAASLAAVSMGMTNVTPATLHNLVLSINNSLEKFVNTTVRMLAKDVLLSTYKAILTQSALLSKDLEERKLWLLHFLSIMKGETGGTMNPECTNVSKQGKILAYGLFQHVKENWDYHCMHFPDSDIGKKVANLPVLQKYASLIKTNMDQLSRPLAKYGPEHSYFYQIFPMIAQTRLLAEQFTKHWNWSEEKGWYVRPEVANRVELEVATKKVLGNAAMSYAAGRQMLLSILNTNGAHWPEKPGPVRYPKRLVEDVQALGALMSSSGIAETFILPEVVVTGSPLPITSGKDKVTITSVLGVADIDAHKHGHSGVDISASYVAIYAPRSGTMGVMGLGANYGDKYMYVKFDNGYTMMLTHLSKWIPAVNRKFRAGDKIAVSGATGTTHPHLHLEISGPDGKPVDPLDPNLPINLNLLLFPDTAAPAGHYNFKYDEMRNLIINRYPGEYSLDTLSSWGKPHKKLADILDKKKVKRIPPTVDVNII